MAIKKIIEIWSTDGLNEENVKFLAKPTQDVIFPLDDESKEVITDLIDTFFNIPCAGIAANQLGHKKRMFIGYSPDDENDYELYINPKIESTDVQSLQQGTEGCLSIPDLTVSITRFDKIKVSYFDEDLKKKNITIEKFISRLFQHELDHLDGRIMFDKNPRDFSSNDFDIKDIYHFYNKYKNSLNNKNKTTCPFLVKSRTFPFFGSFVYSCTAIGNEDCEDKKEIYCLSIEHKNCDNYDERLIL